MKSLLIVAALFVAAAVCPQASAEALPLNPEVFKSWKKQRVVPTVLNGPAGRTYLVSVFAECPNNAGEYAYVYYMKAYGEVSQFPEAKDQPILIGLGLVDREMVFSAFVLTADKGWIRQHDKGIRQRMIAKMEAIFGIAILERS